ncbi:uncharacterized protein LOC126981608 [Eriocheir sinensis]|uniref:uncharacterized protein LOC126981608 n=1 Tax=Eriocheir sinensis TaxID=95602 RepID=UPI0021CA5752|nr:uncharacterized protein LOC126981608 [Eriocheir sinensis]
MPADDSKEQQNAVSLKLPTFWTAQPHVWFEQPEANSTYARSLPTPPSTITWSARWTRKQLGTSSITSVSHPLTTSTRGSRVKNKKTMSILLRKRHLAYISEYITCVQHVSGKSNKVADALSRTAINTIHALAPGLDYTALAAAQEKDKEMPAYRTAISDLVLEDVPFGPANTTLLCDVSTGQPRPIIPAVWRRRVFDIVHNLAHPSIRATKALMATKFMWHGLHKQVGNWARSCIPCQTSKIQRHTKAPPQSFAPPDRRLDHIHVDIVGPFRNPEELLTFSLSWTDSQDGRKRSHSRIRQPPPVRVLSSSTGSPASVCQLTSLQTEVHSSPLHCGRQ